VIFGARTAHTVDLEDFVRRAAAIVVLAALVVAGTSACTYLTPQSTVKTVDASDGINGTVGSIDVRNAMLLTDDGETASFLVSLINRADTGISVKVQYQASEGTKVDHTVFVNAHSVKSYGGPDAPQILFEDIDTPAGALLPVYVQYDDVSGKQLQVPVLNGTLTSYSGLLPSPASTEK
jgi:hypothetical protein